MFNKITLYNHIYIVFVKFQISGKSNSSDTYIKYIVGLDDLSGNIVFRETRIYMAIREWGIR